MANFKYEDYVRQQEQRKQREANGGSTNRPTTRFMGEFFAQKDSVIVRFPYESMDDISFETTHTVSYPGSKFKKRVRCTGDANCPFCGKDVAEKVKRDVRFFAKALVYVENKGQIEVYPVIWDRAAAFAEIDLKSIMDEYGSLTNRLIKIKKSGTGLDTRYTLMPLDSSHPVYNNATCPADFTALDGIDPVKVLTKTVEQYNAALAAENGEEDVPATQAAPAVQEETYEEPTETYEEPTAPAPVETPAPAETASARPIRYKF